MAIESPPSIYWQYFPINDFIARASYAGTGIPGNWTSFWRSVSSNRSVGGHPWSQHLVGLAADHSPASRAFRYRARRAGLIAIDEGSHDHIQGWPPGTLERLYA